MALKKDISENVSVCTVGEFTGPFSQATAEVKTYSGAYIKVAEVHATKAEQTVKVAFYEQQGGRLLFTKTISGLPVDLEGGNNIAQAYEALKQLPEFSGAIDA